MEGEEASKKSSRLELLTVASSHSIELQVEVVEVMQLLVLDKRVAWLPSGRPSDPHCMPVATRSLLG